MRKVKLGVIGCGFISENVYLPNFTTRFNKYLDIAAISDINAAAAKRCAETFHIANVCTVEEMLKDPEIEIVVNLTVPSAHEKINNAALNAGKNVYSEKPVALSVESIIETNELAKKKGLLLGGAPDTFYGAAWQTARKMIDEGWIGKPFSGCTNYCTHGHELWHPNPEFHYKAAGGGPINDSGVYNLVMLIALLGPAKSVSCMSKKTFENRPVYSIPKRGQLMDVEVCTHYAASLRMCNGAVITITISNDTWTSRLPYMEIHGTEGSLFLPQPFNYTTNTASGPLKLVRAETILSDVMDLPQEEIAYRTFVNGASSHLAKDLIMPYNSSGQPNENLRGIGVLDMAYSLVEGGNFRANGDFITHCTEVLCSFDESARKNGIIYQMKTTCERPEPIPVGLPQDVFK